MDYLKFRLIIPFFLIIFTSGYSQEQQTNKSTDNDFLFQDGVYNTIEEFRNNDPFKPGDYVLLSREEINTYIQNHDLSGLYYSTGQYIWLGQFDKSGKFTRIKPDSIWGYVFQEEVFVKHGEYLVKPDVIGPICHFNTASAQLYKPNKGKEYIFEYTSGKFKRFTKSNFMGMISKDMELYQLFLKQDSYKKMKESMMEFLLRFNERNPISTPQ